MVIAIHYNTVSEQEVEDYHFFIHNILPQVVLQHTQHQFYFFHLNKDVEQIAAPNIRYVQLPPYMRLKLLQPWAYKNKLPTIVAKIGAHLFISIGSKASSYTVSLPQIAILANEDRGLKPLSKKGKSSLHKLLLKSVKSAGAVITFSKAFVETLREIAKGEDEKFKVIYNIPQPLILPNTNDDFSIQSKYTDGKGYFIYTGPIVANNILLLLKAFSIFKKRQKSGMKLLIINRGAAHAAFAQTLLNYKYRNDVVYLEALPDGDLAQLLSAAYAFVNPYQLNTTVYLLQSLLAGVPVLTVANEVVKEVAPGAIMIMEKDNVANIADKMMMIYKDENLRNEMIRQCSLFKQEYSYQKAVNLVAQLIEETRK